MKEPHIADRKVAIYVTYLKSKIEKYNHEREKAELFLALKSQIEQITEAIIHEKVVEKVAESYLINHEILDLSKDVTKITKQMDELKKDLDEEIIEKAKQSLQNKTSIKGDYSPEDLAEKFRNMKTQNGK